MTGRAWPVIAVLAVNTAIIGLFYSEIASVLAFVVHAVHVLELAYS